VADHHRLELAAQQLEELGAGLVDGLLGGLVLPPGDGAAVRLQAGRGRPGDDAIDIAGPDQAAEGWYLIELVALGGEAGRAGLDDLGDFGRGDFRIDLTSPPGPLSFRERGIIIYALSSFIPLSRWGSGD
jgi:hypothetical protein